MRSLIDALPDATAMAHLHEILRQLDFDECCSLLGSDGRVAFLTHLKQVGISKLADRQQLANALGRALREAPPSELRPGDARLFCTDWNWCISAEGMAVTNTPGAYLKLRWSVRRPHAGVHDDVVILEVDTSFMTAPSMTLAASFDDAAFEAVPLPHGEQRAVVRLRVPAACPSNDQGARTLTVGVLASVQRYDRWGSAVSAATEANESTTTTLPACSLRLRKVQLPPGAVAEMPALRPRRVLAFGDSIVEGVGADYQRGKGGDLIANRGLHTWVAVAARRLDAEYSAVGFGRLGWSFGGNGNVPRFADSWRFHWAGQRRQFEEASPDVVLVSMGTNDGLITAEAASAEGVSELVATWLVNARTTMGAAVHICVCVPFGGFGGPLMPPLHALPRGFQHYQEQCGGDLRAHLVDLGPHAAKHLSMCETFRALGWSSEHSQGSSTRILPARTQT